MGQIFKKRANAIARLVIFGGPALIFLTGAVFYVLGQSDYLTRVHSPLDQSVPFSHQHHVGGLGMSFERRSVGRTISSWLLTGDHKRIALLYMVSITLFFFVGGTAAALIRLELLSPKGELVTSETYNKLFTIHGVVMVWFFLIPSIPSVLGNFLLPLMIGARDVAFPRLNLASWYLFMVGGAFTLFSIVTGGVDTG